MCGKLGYLFFFEMHLDLSGINMNSLSAFATQNTVAALDNIPLRDLKISSQKVNC